MTKQAIAIFSLALFASFLLGIVVSPYVRHLEETAESIDEETEEEEEETGHSHDGGELPTLATCDIYPADNPWNTDISAFPVHARSDEYIRSIGLDGSLHPDFGGDGEYGIPYDIVHAGQPMVPITFVDYADESDPGPYPIPPDARIENGDDGHVLVLDDDACKLYELYGARKDPTGPGWTASNGAVFDLKSNALRPDYWTSADAAGLPIYPGLVKYDEAVAGTIDHAIRFTASETQRAFIHPATHYASRATDPKLPPMGLRLRLKADFDTSDFPGYARHILDAMKTYGLILADNGGDWFFTGAQDTRWDDELLETLKDVPGSAFEAVETGPLVLPQ